MKEMDSSPQAAPGLLGQPVVVFATDTANRNARKRRKPPGIPVAAAPLPLQQPQSCSPAVVSLAQHQMHPTTHDSNALDLTSEEKQHHRRWKQSNLFFATSSSLFSGEFFSQINHESSEMEQFLLTQGEQLRRTLAERLQRHCLALLWLAKESGARRLREKDAETEQLARRRAVLEDRIAKLRTDSMTWQAKAMADRATAASLNAQLQQAAAASIPRPEITVTCGDRRAAEDAESANVDPCRIDLMGKRGCRLCGWRWASVVLLPCRHLCLCDACDACDATAESCPVCHRNRTGSVHVFLS